MPDICQMVKVHHSDCECGVCKLMQDERCTSAAVGTHEHNVRVCEPCGRSLEDEGFRIDWDNYDGPKDGEAWNGGFAENH
jgi:hypothetical protein